MTKAEIKSKFDEIVAFAEVEKFIDTPVKRYSSGMQVRLAFAVAAHLDPEILIVDEVLAVGDMEFQRKCIGQMDRVAKKGRTVLFVSHNMGIISKLCQRGILLENGQIRLIDSIDSVVKHYLSRPSSSGNVDLSPVKIRSGSGKALFDRVITRNGDGAICDTFTIGDNIAIDVTIINGQWLRSGRMSLQISSSEGIPIYHLVAYDAGFELNNLRDKETVRVVLKKQKLYPGDYYVSLWLADRAYTMLDKIENAFKFTVIEGGTLLCRPIDKSSAIVHEIPEWSIVRS
jgi:lipopolysaccharide transport system ATP-binding protein